VRDGPGLQAMERSRIVILNCAKGIIGETPAFLIGALVLARVQAAGMARARLKPHERRPFHVVIDEAQSFGPEVIASLVAESRKFGLSVTVATQHLSGINEKLRDALLTVVKTLVVFQVGDKDAELLAPEFDRAQQSFNPYALRQLGVGEAMIRISSRGTSEVLIDAPHEPAGRAEIVRKQSRLHYGTARSGVERNIARCLQPPKAGQSLPGTQQGGRWPRSLRFLRTALTRALQEHGHSIPRPGREPVVTVDIQVVRTAFTELQLRTAPRPMSGLPKGRKHSRGQHAPHWSVD
jgi:hypothetical protein